MINLTTVDPGKAVWTEMELAGSPFEIELLPCLSKDWAKNFLPFSKTKNIPNVMTKGMAMIEYFDVKDPKYMALIDDLLDTHVRNFRGISLNGVEMDGTKRENKLTLGSVKVIDEEVIEYEDGQGGKGNFKQKRERLFRQLIFEKIQDLAAVKAEAETKNSVSSLPSSVEAGT